MSKTPLFIIAVIVSIAVFDVYVIQDEGVQNSISAVLIRWSHEYPSIPFLMGFTMGHLFWRISDKRLGKK